MILNNYSSKTKILDISNKNIEGILDLDQFQKLEKLDCSNNKITKIINIPITLKYLNCSSNLITSLYLYKNLINDIKSFQNLKKNQSPKLEELDCSNNKITEIENIPVTLKYLNCSSNLITSLYLPDNLTGINCKKNPLKKLDYPCDVKPSKWPSQLTHLYLSGYFNQLLNNLPNSLIQLVIGDNFNQPIDNLPNSITELSIGDEFNQSINNLPNSIMKLELGFNFNQPISKLPNSLTYIMIGNSFNQEINDLPDSLKYIWLGYNFDKKINNLPNNLKSIFIGNKKSLELVNSKYHHLVHIR